VQGNRSKIKEHWYERVPESVETSREGQVTTLCSQRLRTEKIRNNKPDIVNRDSKKATCVFIDVAISGHRTVIKT
jgi:hypothetical protein